MIGIMESSSQLTRRIEMFARKNLLPLVIGLCLLVSVAIWSWFLYVQPKIELMENVVAVVNLTEYVPLEKFPTEPPAFLEKVQALGEKLIVEAGETLHKESISPEEQGPAIDKMLWGLKFKYGDDWDVFAEKLILFCDFLTEGRFHNPFTYHFDIEWREYLKRMATRLAIEENIKLDDFERICDTLVHICGKYNRLLDEHIAAFIPAGQDYMLICFIADVLDPDTTRGFVQLAAQKLGLDPDVPNDPPRHLDDSIMGTIRRTRLLGKELPMSGVDKDGNTVDLTQFRGKPVLLVATNQISEANRNISNKLHELLQGDGLVMLKVQPDAVYGGMGGYHGGMGGGYDRPITAEEVATFPGTVVKSPFYDFYYCSAASEIMMNPTIYPGEEFCLFLIDPQGKVVRLQNNGYDAALCRDLKAMFPAKETGITALQAEIQANQNRWTDEKNKRNVVYQSKNLDGVKRKLLSLYEIIDPNVNNHFFQMLESYKNLRSEDSQWHQWFYSGLVFPAFHDFPDFPEVSPELRFRVLLSKTNAKHIENVYRCFCDPKPVAGNYQQAA